MRNLKKIILTILVLTFSSCKSQILDSQLEKTKSETNIFDFPKQVGFVNDFENIFTEEQKTQLTKLLAYYKENSNREIVIITIASVPNNTEFDSYAIKISQNWGVGKDDYGNGLTIVISKSLRKVRISTTDKTQYYLTDEFCQKVINENMIPEFKNGNYFDGLLSGMTELIKKWI